MFAKEEERETVEIIAREAGCNFLGLWLTAPPATLISRVEHRQGDASDADRRVVREQLSYDLGHMDWVEVDASGTPQDSCAAALRALTTANNPLVDG